ncbi:MAG TPA: pyridoxine 5'-phosphate synthase [Xanthobacteraceae bacterium]|nr:pyridoxine 5'-phosphate synthase [Xanthobacteraceae bacterium]
MIRLSVNLNKIALLRNARNTGVPDLLDFGRRVLESGAKGITVHPRPDARHIRWDDVFALSALMQAARPAVEFNIEGRPTPEFLERVLEVRPEQVTLVPDSAEVLTSDKGWDLTREERAFLRPLIEQLKAAGSRTCLFMDPDPAAVERVEDTGADGIEVYTGTFAAAFRRGDCTREFAACMAAATVAQRTGLIVNAGHDLNLRNLPSLIGMPGLREVSIGHELTVDALLMGFAAAIAAYRAVLEA